MAKVRDEESLERERAYLREVDARPKPWQRWRGYWKLSGPGWVQSALTLGAGTAGSSIFAGAVFGYRLLWVQPVAMFLGVVMFAAIGHQLVLTRERPYEVFWKRLHPSVALFWGINVLLASIVWQFPQYALGTEVLKDVLDVLGADVAKWPLALVILVGATAVCWSYGSGSRRGVRNFERILKYFLLAMVLSFFLVVVKTGIDWGEMLRGFFSFHVPRTKEGLTIVMGQLGAAVGVNMTFLYPSMLLSRGWGKEHRGLKNFDLATTMFFPFVLATSFVIMACANTLHVRGIKVQGALDAARALEPLIGLTAGRLVFSLGVLSMCFTTAVIEMLICGFVLAEMFRFEPKGKAYKAATMLANIGILGAFTKLPIWLPVLTSSLNLLMMPIAYIGFFILQNKRSYLGDEVNRGLKGAAWNAVMLVAVLVVAAGAAVRFLSLLGVF
jgi:manganese transport protein